MQWMARQREPNADEYGGRGQRGLHRVLLQVPPEQIRSFSDSDCWLWADCRCRSASASSETQRTRASCEPRSASSLGQTGLPYLLEGL